MPKSPYWIPAGILAWQVLAAPLSAQTTETGTLTVVVKNTDGQLIEHAYLSITTGGVPPQHISPRYRRTFTLPAGASRLLVRALGYERIDTSLVVAPGRHDTLSLVMEIDRWIQAEQAQRDRADSMRRANGGIDSITAGHVVPDSAGHFTFSAFGIDLLRAAIRATSADESRIVSPLSAGQALGMALLAARDSSARAIAATLHLGQDVSVAELAERSHRFMELSRRRRDLTLSIANGIWVDTSATLQPDFQRSAETQYQASARTLPLSDSSMVPVLNRWADSLTAGRIKSIREQPYDTSTKVVLTNAVYLKSVWLEPFDTLATRPRPFTTARGHRLELPAMEREAGLAYRRGEGYQAVRLPYLAGLSAMYLVLPDSGVPAVELLARLSREGWPLPKAGGDQKLVRIRLPKMRVRQQTPLIPVFDSLGLGIIADPRGADFQGLVIQPKHMPPMCPPINQPQPDFCTRYYVSEAAQDVFLDVDEVGTEAAAVTAVGFTAITTSAGPRSIPFFVDRPFLFAIRDERTGVMLFVGYVADPRQ